jgi:hypothetical protein
MKRLLALAAVLLVGCGGADFTAADVGPVVEDAGTGGATGTGGAVTEDAGTGGGQPESGGAQSESGGATSATGGTGGAAEAGDACVLVTHSNGLGQTWQDCVPLGTYNEEQALKACKASVAVQCVVLQYCGNPIYSMRGYDVSGSAVGDWGYGGSRGGVVAIGDMGSDCVASAYNSTWD